MAEQRGERTGDTGDERYERRDSERPEKRWFQKPEFIFIVVTYLIAQGVTYLVSSSNTAASAATQSSEFRIFQKSVTESLQSIRDQQKDLIVAWRSEHDDNRELRGQVVNLGKAFDEFKDDYKKSKQLSDTYMQDTRERVGKLEVRK